MPKEKLTLSVDKDVVKKAKNLGINISEITENVLKGFTSPRPEGSLHEAYKDLFDSILPLLKQFDCRVKIAESLIEFEDEEGNVERVGLQDESYLASSGAYLIKDHEQGRYYTISDLTKIPIDEFLPTNKILENLLSELAKSQEKRKEKMEEILMAKRIIEAMSESLLKKPPTKQNDEQ